MRLKILSLSVSLIILLVVSVNIVYADEEVFLELYTDYPDYMYGDRVEISGIVNRVIGPEPIILTILNEEGGIVHYTDVNPNPDGFFLQVFSFDEIPWSEYMIYTVEAEYQNHLSVITFNYLSEIFEITDNFVITEECGKGFEVGYTIENGSLENIIPHSNTFGIIMNVNTADHTDIILDLPRGLIDSVKEDGTDDDFIIIIDRIATGYKSFLANSDSRVIEIFLEHKNQNIEVEIIGTYLGQKCLISEFKTDKTRYNTNEIIIISGTFDSLISGDIVTSTIINPHHGEVIREKQITINDDYTFEDKFALDYRVWKFSGDYIYEIDEEQVIINYTTGTSRNQINYDDIIIEFDKIADHNGNVEYYYGETLHVTGEVSQIIEGENIHIVIENDDDIYDEEYNKILDSTLTVNSDRTFSFDFDIPLDLWIGDDQNNDYKVKMYYDDYYGKKEFRYEHGVSHFEKVKIESTSNGFSPNLITVAIGNQILARNMDENNTHSFVSGVVVNGAGIPDGIFNSGELEYGEPIFSDNILYHSGFIGTISYFCNIHLEEQGEIVIEYVESITVQTNEDSYFNNQTVNLIIDIPVNRIKDNFNVATYDPMNNMISFIETNYLSVGNNNIMLLPSNNNSMDIPGTYIIRILGEHATYTTFEYISNEPHWN